MEISKAIQMDNPVLGEKIGGAGGVNPTPTKPGEKTEGSGLATSFQDTLDRVSNPALKGVVTGDLSRSAPIRQAPAAAAAGADAIKFSNHAVERMTTRGISFNPADMTRLNEAVNKAAAKGSKDTLVLMNDSALIVSVKNKTVVTVMDQAALKENVFTNIDSTIVM